MPEFCTSDGKGGCAKCSGSYIPCTLQNCPAPKYRLPANWQSFCNDAKPVAVPKTRPGANPLPLGDYTEAILSGLGVTKDKWVAVKKRFGAIPKCGCPERQKWLNDVGNWLATLLE